MRPGAYCAATFWMPGGAAGIMIARIRVTEKIILSAKLSYYTDDTGRGKGSDVRRTQLDTETSHL